MSHMLINLQKIVNLLILGAFLSVLGGCATAPPTATSTDSITPNSTAFPTTSSTASSTAPPIGPSSTVSDPTRTARSTENGDPVAQWPSDDAPLPPPRLQAKSRWEAVRWRDLPGFNDDTLYDAWNAWLRSCERPGPVFAPLCAQVRLLSIASEADQRRWIMQNLQAYRVSPLTAGTPSDGLLTAYYEPLLEASASAAPGFTVPLYRLPSALSTVSSARGARPWFTRQEIDTLPEARAALVGREIAWLANPIDVLVLHIQGSGRLVLRDTTGGNTDGSTAGTATTRTVRVAFAGTNGQPYKSVGRWLIDQGQLRDASWPSIKQWIAQNPQRVQEMLWSNPRFVFFKDEPLTDADRDMGPKGAQGVPLTAGRSIAVDPGSIPYGTPVWLSSHGPTVRLQRLVFAQDTGSAITGAVRADYYAGAGLEAGEMAGRLKQGLALWALWPKGN